VKRLLPWLALLAACSKASRPSDAVQQPPVPDPFIEPSASVPAAPSSTASSAPSSSSSTSGAVARSSVKLLDPGQAPRRTLRYAWRPERKELMALELRTGVSADTGGESKNIPLPPIHVTVAVEPQSVTPDGDLRFAWHVESAEVRAADAAAPDPMTEGWKAQLAPVAHLSGSAQVSALGISRGVSVDPGSAGDAGPDAEMVVTVLELLRNDAVAPLPDEAVGKGARWQKLSTLDAKGAHATQTDTYTLADVPGDTGSLDDVFAQTVSPQALPPPPGVQGPSPGRMDSLLMSGTAKLRFDLSRFVSQTTRDATTSVAVSGPASRMNMVMRVGMTVQGTLR
jgi:hypothetical protein